MKINKLKCKFYCYCKSFCNRRRGEFWQNLYWFFFYKSYNAIDKVYGKQSNNSW